MHTNHDNPKPWLTVITLPVLHTGAMHTTNPHRASSLPTSHRIATLDVLRGLALVGILVVNMEYYSQTVYDGWVQPQFHGSVDRAVRWFIIALFQLKAYLLFALLFGYGIGMQLQANASARAVKTNHLRRMTTLALLGALHAVLLFSGDILITYALCGLISMALWRSSASRLLAWSALAFVTGLFNGVWLVLLSPDAMTGSIDIAAVREIYAHGTVPEVLKQRWVDIAAAFPLIFLVQGPMSLAMLSLGIAMARLAALTAPRRMLRWGLPLGLLVSVVVATLTLGNSAASLAAGVAFLLQLLAAPALCLGFVAWFARLGSRPLPRHLLWFAPSGRMSLTVYIGQSLLCTLIFTSYGLGLFAQIGPGGCLLIAAAVSLFFVVFSRQWFKYYRFGPLEWLLRSCTYGCWQPLRKAP